MALDSSALADALAKVFGSDFPASAEDAGTAWAAAYRSYADAAEAIPAKPVPASLDAAEKLLATSLGKAFTAARDTGPATLTKALDAAFVAFWFAPPVAFVAGGVAGVVTTVPPGVIDPLLAAVFAAGVAKGRTASGQAQAIADVLHGWTRTVVVSNTPPVPPATVPLT